MIALCQVASVFVFFSGVYGAVTWRDHGDEGGRFSRYIAFSLGAMAISAITLICAAPFFL